VEFWAPCGSPVLTGHLVQSDATPSPSSSLSKAHFRWPWPPRKRNRESCDFFAVCNRMKTDTHESERSSISPAGSPPDYRSPVSLPERQINFGHDQVRWGRIGSPCRSVGPPRKRTKHSEFRVCVWPCLLDRAQKPRLQVQKKKKKTSSPPPHARVSKAVVRRAQSSG
jgi:hypothetical protein